VSTATGSFLDLFAAMAGSDCGAFLDAIDTFVQPRVSGARAAVGSSTYSTTQPVVASKQMRLKSLIGTNCDDILEMLYQGRDLAAKEDQSDQSSRTKRSVL
jgi:hypothetical protein